MNLDKILVCITNYNENTNAIKLKSDFSPYIDTIIIDSGSVVIDEQFDIKLGNVYYSGLFNESVRQTKLRDKEYLLFVASDVYIDSIDKLIKSILSLDDVSYLYAPSSKGQSHKWCKKSGDGIREVMFVEGFMFMSKLDLCEMVYPIDLNINKYGYGLDIILGYHSYKTFNSRCVVDNDIEVYHKEGTGYDMNLATKQMIEWCNTLDVGSKQFMNYYLSGNTHDVLLKILKEKC